MQRTAMSSPVFLERSGLPVAGIFLLLELYPAWRYRAAFRTLCVAKFAS